MSSNPFGFLLALIPLVCWGLGDFYIQKTARIVGVWKALFFIGVTAALVLFPLVRHEIPTLTLNSILLLSTLVVVGLFTSLFDLEALKEGKIAIVEPLIGLELPLTVSLSVFLYGERLSAWQAACIAIVFVGIVLAITKRRVHLHYHRRLFERGVLFAGLGAIGLALTTLLVGIASQKISPLLTIWFSHSALGLIAFIYLCAKGEARNLWKDVKKSPRPIMAESLLDNAAWIGFAWATTFTSISIVATISGSYIALAAWLGILMNRERIRRHQAVGVVLAIVGVVVLAAITQKG